MTSDDAIWTSLPVPALILDSEDCIVAINAAAEGFLNTSSKSIRGQKVWEKVMKLLGN